METSGILRFEPPAVTKKHKRQAEWKRTAIIELDPDITRYYGWFINKRYNIKLATPFRGTHLTIINDKVFNLTLYNKAIEEFNGTQVSLKFDTDVRTDGEHWWLPADSDFARVIRRKCSLDPEPYFAFHITIGNVYEKHIDHSFYIKGLIDKFGKNYT